MSGVLQKIGSLFGSTATGASAGGAIGGGPGAAIGGTAGALGNLVGGSDSGGVGGSTGPLGGLTSLLQKGLGYLGMTGSPANVTSAPTNFSDPLNMHIADPSSTDFSAAGGPGSALPTGTGLSDPYQSASSASGSSAAQWVGVGSVGQSYMNYLMNRRLALLNQRTAYAGGHSTPNTPGLPQLSLYPSASFAVPQLSM